MIAHCLAAAAILFAQPVLDASPPQADSTPAATEQLESAHPGADEESPEDAQPEGEEPAEAEDAPPIPERFGPAVSAPVEPLVEDEHPADTLTFPCEQLDYLWTGPQAGEPPVDENRPRSLEAAAFVYAEYLRHLFLSPGNAAFCEVAHDPIITLANAAAAVARGRGSVTEMARVLGSNPEGVQALWLLDAIVRNDREFAGLWRNYFGAGPAFRIIDLIFDELPRGGVPVYQALLGITDSAHGVYADYIAYRFIGIFANSPQWVLVNAERLIPFGPALRLIFCNYLSVPEREALVLRYGEFPYSDAQVAVIELVACL